MRAIAQYRTVPYVRALAPLCIALCLAACASAPAPAVVYLVRHAEKAPDPGDGDPDLNEAGHARAVALARSLGDARIDVVLLTNRKRTRQTAAPLVKARGLTPTEFEREDTAALAAEIRRLPPGTRALVVNHSDTLPRVLTALGLEAPKIGHGDYDDLFVVIQVGETRELERLHYGAVARDID